VTSSASALSWPRDRVSGATCPDGRPAWTKSIPVGLAQTVGRVTDYVQRLAPGRLPFSHEGIWMAALQPHCDDSRTIGELGITSRDLLMTLTDTVWWLAEQGHLPVSGRGRSLNAWHTDHSFRRARRRLY